MILPMVEDLLTRAHLNRLTNAELFSLAENMGIDVLNEQSDRFSLIEELLETKSSYEGDREQDTKDIVELESVLLPKQYNITYIELMIRDPFWAFVFWEIKASDKEQFEDAPDFNGYHLKVSPLKEGDNFTVPVKPSDTARYLGLTPVEAGKTSWTNDRQYKVELCVSLGGNETVLAASNPVRLPGLPEYRDGAEMLITLSGYDDFRILRKNERLHRTKSYE